MVYPVLHFRNCYRHVVSSEECLPFVFGSYLNLHVNHVFVDTFLSPKYIIEKKVSITLPFSAYCAKIKQTNFIEKVIGLLFKTECLFLREKYLTYREVFFMLVVTYCIAISSIVRADYNYIDDLGRTAFGYRGWLNFSRYVSEYTSIILHQKRYLADISPLTQLLAVVILAMASVILLDSLNVSKRHLKWSALAVLPLGLTPYFLECLSYKFDSPYMAISVLAGIFPFLFKDRDWRIYGFVTSLGTMIVFTTYQAASGICIILCLFICALKWNKGESYKNIVRFSGITGMFYGLSLLLFKVILMKPVDTYVKATINISELPYNLVNNIKQYFSLLYYDSTRVWIVLTILICLMFILAFIEESNRSKWQASVVAVLIVPITMVMSYGLYLALPKPLFAPRGMYGIGAWLAILSVLAISRFKYAYITRVICLGLSWCMFSFAFMYGNALAEQKRYTDYRVQMVINDLSYLGYLAPSKLVAVALDGNIGLSPIVIRRGERFHVLNRLVVTTFGRGWHWSKFYFYNYFGPYKPKEWQADKTQLKSLNMKILKDTVYHTIKTDGKHLVIMLKE